MDEGNKDRGAANDDAARAGRRALAALAVWALAALAASAAGAIARMPRPLVPVLIWSPVVAVGCACARWPSLRAWLVGRVDLRALVLYHAIRVPYGAGFLALYAQGRLPAAFALPAGVGDIAAGLGALAAAALAGRAGADGARAPWRRRAVFAWNAFALADIVMVFLTAQRLTFIEHDGRVFAALARAPFSLLPALVVPLVVLTHLLVFAQLRAAARAERAVRSAAA